MWAIKFRPKILDDVLGQEWPKEVIRGALQKKPEALAWLIVGVWGTGKTTITRILGKSIACSEPTQSGEACQQCQSCKAIEAEASPNYTELDAASTSGADDMRDLIREVYSAPVGDSPKRTVALDEAHMLSRVAQNVLLKTLDAFS